MDTRGDSKRSHRGHARESRRKKVVLDLDLNDTPPGENRAARLDESTRQGGRGGAGVTLPPPAATIDLEAIDDEVVISSPRSFAEARNKSRRNQDVTVLDVVSLARHQEEAATRLTLNSYNMRKRPLPNQAVINCDHYINLDGKSSAKRKSGVKPPEPPQTAPPPKEPTFVCPVCMGALVDGTSTKCGHIFCQECIKAAVEAQHKCPTCRTKISLKKDTFRIYFPATIN